ncbi:MAG: hypothetical protein M3Y87_27075, partial [Myxococcota bacterium]|nr:hypothetical protein [Myxococcota bacterium]
ARALARRPRVLLLDEPLAALDRDARHQLTQSLAAWSAAHDVTTILVAHDESDVAALATDTFAIGSDRIARVPRA